MTPPPVVEAVSPARKPLRPLDEALAQLLGAARPVCAEQPQTLPLVETLGRVLVQSVSSLVDVPPADNSAMDGIALRACDAPQPGTVLPLSQRVAAGQVGAPLQPGTAARIFTGAPVPDGADAVVMQEECEFLPGEGGELGSVRVQAAVKAGQHVRRRAEEIAQGAVVLQPGCRLDAAAIGLAASVGIPTLTVARRPRVALFSTGDELVTPGEPLPPGAIYNSNRYTLHALLDGMGCEVVDLGIVPDNLEATRAALRTAARDCDVILTSGGVSVGEEDHVKPAVQAEGSLDLWAIAIKPGKPLAFGAVRRPVAAPAGAPGETGTDAGEAWFLGLPGNPVAAYVTFLILVRPFLLRLQGVSDVAPKAWKLPVAFDWPKADKRREFVRARVGEDGRLERFANQGSAMLTSLVWSDGLIDIPAGQTLKAGDVVTFYPLRELA